MLSQSRKKLKWSHDPKNTFWANNTTAFGHQMLKKMGWEKGKGLGVNEDGNAEPVKLNANKTKQGLGCTGYDNTWLAHQDDFSAILSELNDFADKEDNCTARSSKVVSLEETSKSQKRLHYKKFTRGKDLSNYNESDMNGIFGLKSQSLPATPSHCSDDDDDNSANDCLSNCNDKKIEQKQDKTFETSSKLQLSSLVPADYNVTDYFKMKLEKLKQRRTQKITASDSLSMNDSNSGASNKDFDKCNLEKDCSKLQDTSLKQVYAVKQNESEIHKGTKRKKKLKKLKSKKSRNCN